MPPDISAGPMALARTPGVTAAGKGGAPPVSGVLSATLFASFLAQSSPPDLTAVPKIAVPKIAVLAVTKPFLNAILPAAKAVKTMDTLPKISLLSMGTAKSNASELPLHHVLDSHGPAHKTAPDDTAGANTPNTLIQTPSAAPAIAPNPALVPILVPPALLGLTLPLMLPASGGAAPQRAASAASVASVSVPTLSASLEASVPLRSAPNANHSLAGLPLPRMGTLTTRVSAALQPVPPVPSAVALAAAAMPDGDAKASAPAEISSARLSSTVLTRVLPNAPSSTQSNTQSNLAQSYLAQSKDTAQAAPQVAGSLLRLPSMPAPIFLASSSIAMSAAASVLVPSSIGGQALPAPIVPAKSNAKFAQIALKPTPENADNNTRTLSREEPQVSAKIAASAVSLHQTSEASYEKPRLTTDLNAKKTAEPAAPQAAQALLPAAQAANADSKPLSAADHAEMVRQVADGVGAMPLPTKPGGVQQMSLQLHPKDWGSLQISVSVTPGQETGSAKIVTAHIVAETPQVKAALQSQTGALHQALRASGLKLEHLTVSVKPASEAKMSEAKMPEVKPAGESASAGFSSEQGQPNAQGQSSAGSSQAEAGQPSGTAFSGSGQDARQGQAPPAFAQAPAQAEPELEEINVVRLPMRPAIGRVDTHA